MGILKRKNKRLTKSKKTQANMTTYKPKKKQKSEKATLVSLKDRFKAQHTQKILKRDFVWKKLLEKREP